MQGVPAAATEEQRVAYAAASSAFASVAPMLAPLYQPYGLPMLPHAHAAHAHGMLMPAAATLDSSADASGTGHPTLSTPHANGSALGAASSQQPHAGASVSGTGSAVHGNSDNVDQSGAASTSQQGTSHAACPASASASAAGAEAAASAAVNASILAAQKLLEGHAAVLKRHVEMLEAVRHETNPAAPQAQDGGGIGEHAGSV